jgi:hypothetical protein
MPSVGDLSSVGVGRADRETYRTGDGGSVGRMTGVEGTASTLRAGPPMQLGHPAQLLDFRRIARSLAGMDRRSFANIAGLPAALLGLAGFLARTAEATYPGTPGAITHSRHDCFESQCFAYPAFSPDGKHIAFVGIGRDSSDLQVMRTDGRGFAKEFDEAGTEEEGYGTHIGAPAWGPVPR